MEVISKKLRRLRINYGLTQEEVALTLGLKKNMLSNYELGRNTVSPDILTEISNYYGTTLEFFYEPDEYTLKEGSPDETETFHVYTGLHGSNFDDICNENEIIFDITLPSLYFDRGNYFGIKIADECLNKKGFHTGSIAIAKKQNVAKEGDVVIYIYDDKIAHYGVYSRGDKNITISPCSDDKSFKKEVYDILDPKFRIIGKVSFLFGHVL